MLQIGDGPGRAYRTVPAQFLVRSPKASNNLTELMHGTSILEVATEIPSPEELETIQGLRVMRLPQALVYSGPRLFTNHPVDARAALALIRDASEILPVLLDGGHSTVAGRLAGAFRNFGRTRIADDILKAMRAAGYTVTETNPFEDHLDSSHHRNHQRRERNSGREPITDGTVEMAR